MSDGVIANTQRQLWMHVPFLSLLLMDAALPTFLANSEGLSFLANSEGL
jgi:hypothetical protein